MGSDVLTTIETNVRAVLADTGTTFTTATVDAGIFAVVSDISRIAPRELVHIEVLHSRTITDESITSSDDTWVDLANKPIDMQQSVVVTSDPAGTTYTEDTDYIIDYAQGRIQTIGVGAISDATGILVSYEKSLRGIDLSSITALIGIDRVEIAKSGGQSFQTYTGFYQWGDVLWLHPKDGVSDQNLAENDHVRIWYKAEHSKPGAAAGSYPAFLDDVVTKGAAAYALFSKHRERNLAAVADLALARTALLKADDDQTAIDTLEAAVTTALDSAKTALASANTAFALVDAIADTPLGDAETALDAVITNLGTEAEALLDSATYTGFNTSIESALDGAAALLDETSSVVKTALDSIVQHLETDTFEPDSADNQLKTGDDFINNVNVGADVPNLFARYAEVKVLIARGRTDEAIAYISQARGQIEEAAQRLIQWQLWLSEVDARISISNTYVAEARERLNIAGIITQTGLGYVQEAGGYIDEATGRMQQIDRHIQLGALYISQTRVYQENADRENQSADRFLFDAQERHRDYWEHLTSRVEMAWPHQRQSAVRQNPQ